VIPTYKFRLFLFSAILFLAATAGAQQLPLYSQYMMNKFLLNPAVAGSEGYTAINLTAREQWIGFGDSPLTHAVSAQTRILRNSFISKSASIRKRQKGGSRSGKVGLGGYVFNDRTGILNRTGVQLTYAYHIFISPGQLSFGLSGTAYQLSIDQSKLRLETPNPSDDPFFQKVNSSMIIPDANVGVYYSDPKMYIGLSASQLFQASLKFGNKGYEEYRLLRHYFLIGGYDLNISDFIMVEPSFLVKTSETWRFQVDAGAKVYFQQNYWAGLAYRTGGAIIGMGGVKVDKFFFGYAFDYTLSSIMKHSLGSHEFMFAVKFGDSARRYKWLIRY
jgi:type IX secretion system PorP/SprF family membrane protein